MLVNEIRNEMVIALKNGDKERKQTLSMLVSALDLAAKEKRSPLSEDEEFAVLRKELKQTKETLEEAQKANREDMAESANQRIAVIDSFLPALMDENAIKSVIDCTPRRRTLSTSLNASSIGVVLSIISLNLSFGITIRVSTCFFNSSRLKSAFSILFLPSNVNGLVTIATVSAPRP